MGKCKFCDKSDKLISEVLEICRDCVLNKDWNVVRQHILTIHKNMRDMVELPEAPPKAEDNIKLKCNYCVNECILSENNVSYCELRNVQKNQSGELPYPTKARGYIHGYLDPNPTNCCNAWFCPAGTSTGYPEFSSFRKIRKKR